MKAKNLFSALMVTLFGVIVESSGQVGTYPANETSYLGVNPINSIYSVHIGKDAAPNAAPTPAQVSASLEGMNCFIGVRSGKSITSGNNNVFLGYQSGVATTTGGYNSFLGRSAGAGNVEGEYNTFVGFASGYKNGKGRNNTYLGYNTGYSNFDGSGNVFIGNRAGSSIVGPIDNKLIISNDHSFTPLVYGDFVAKYIDLNGNVGINLASNAVPGNSLEIRKGTNVNGGTSGLRFTNLRSNFIPTTAANKFLTVDVNGDVILQNLPNLANVTNTLTNNNVNTLTSTVNGVAASAPIVNTVVNTITGNSLVTKVNGVSSNSVPLPSTTTVSAGNASVTVTPSGNNYSIVANIPIDNDSNPTNELQTLSMVTNTTTNTYDISLSNGGNTNSTAFGTVQVPMAPLVSLTSADLVTTTVNNPSPNTFTIAAKNIYTDDGTLDSNRIVTMNSRSLIFNTGGNTTTTGGRIYIGNTSLFNPANFPIFNDSNPLLTRDYRLYVEGGILSERMRVALRSSSNWADYVFANEYKLMPLKELETFIKANKHLPGIESADELAKNGLDLGDMQAKQMGKIEELTLHLIEQNKTLEKQSKEIEELKAQVKLLLEKK